MDEELLARARAAANPFATDRVDSAWDEPLADVEDINRTAFQRCLETIRTVRDSHQSRGLLLPGEPGAGKTHLLQRLRRWIQEHTEDSFIYVPPVGGPDRFFRDVLQRLVGDLVRPRSKGRSNQLEAIVLREIVRAETRANLPAAAFWADVRRRNRPGEALFSWLLQPMQRLCERLQLEPDVVRVLCHYLAEHHRFDAYTWLIGRALSDEALSRLGVSKHLEDDVDAYNALIALARLAGHDTVLVLAFDQLEGLQFNEHDTDGLNAFANGIVRLFVDCRNLVAVSCVQNYFKEKLNQTVPPAHMHRIAQDEAPLTLLGPDTAEKLVQQRLNQVPEIVVLRSTLAHGNQIWPLSRDAVRCDFDAGGLSARQLLKRCREQFEEWRCGTPPPRPVGPAEGLVERWDAQVQRELEMHPDDGIYADGLLKVLEVHRPGRAGRGRVRDIDIQVPHQEGDTGIAICGTASMTSLAGRLRRLLNVAESGRIKRLVVVRDERLPVSTTARATRERLEQLEELGHYFIRPPAEAYAAVAAARQLLAEAAAGDLSIDGRPIAVPDLKSWLLSNPTTEVKELLRALDGGEPRSTDDDFIDRLTALIDGRWLMPAAEAAQALGCSEQMLVAHVSSGQRQIGILVGPPSVVFLRPEGIIRI